VTQDTYHHPQRAEAYFFHVNASLFHPLSAFSRHVYYRLNLSINSSILTWTHHVFDKVKVIIVGNGYNILGYGTLNTFLLAPGEYINANSYVQATNLRNIVQNPDERVAILTRSSNHYPSIRIERPRTFGTSGTSDTCMSPSPRLSGSSGRGSAAARSGLIRKKTRFARKPLIKTH
jgi:hypothetical protein